MPTANIEIGCIAKDSITGYQGVVTARTEWLNGCVRFALQSQKLTKEGKPFGEQWFDVEQLVRVKKTAAGKWRTAKAPSGGPQRDPTF